MPTYELWVEDVPGCQSMAGMCDTVTELNELRAALNVSIERCEVAILDQGVPSNYLPELQILPLAEMLERGDDCDCGCGCGRRSVAFHRVLDD